MSEVQGLTIDFKNNNKDFTGADGEGISIYNQRYAASQNTILSNISEADFKTILGRCIHGNLERLQDENNVLFSSVNWAQRESDGAYVIPIDHVLVFECVKNVNGTNLVSYYCYFKDHTGNSWLIYVIDNKTFPVVFDLQENLEPVVTFVDPTQETKQITSISTGNFYMGSKSNVLVYTGIQLKNTSFNVAIDEQNEQTEATITPRYAFTIQSA